MAFGLFGDSYINGLYKFCNGSLQVRGSSTFVYQGGLKFSRLDADDTLKKKMKAARPRIVFMSIGGNDISPISDPDIIYEKICSLVKEFEDAGMQVDNDLSADEIPASESDILQLSQPAGIDHCELSVTCKPYCNVSILGVCIVSEARTVECYSNVDGYIASIRGEVVDAENVTGEDRKKLYHGRLKLPDLLSQISFKFFGFGDGSLLKIYKLKFVLVQGQEDSNIMRSRSGNIDIAKVKGYLHSMGDSVPDSAVELLQSVEQFQKNQMSGFHDMQNMFAGLKLGQSGEVGLTGLLSVVSKLGPISNQIQKHDSDYNIKEKMSNDEPNSIHHPVNMTPLERLARSVTHDEGQSHSDGLSNNMMYKMLQNICGSVSQMRDVKSVQKQEDNDTIDDIRMNDHNRICQETAEVEMKNELPPVATGMNTEELQMTIQQTVSEIFVSTEQRLKNYIDTSLHALEDRLSQKLDSLMKQLVNNGQSPDVP